MPVGSGEAIVFICAKLNTLNRFMYVSVCIISNDILCNTTHNDLRRKRPLNTHQCTKCRYKK